MVWLSPKPQKPRTSPLYMYACLYIHQTTKNVTLELQHPIGAQKGSKLRQHIPSPFDPFWLTTMGTLLFGTHLAWFGTVYL